MFAKKVMNSQRIIYRKIDVVELKRTWRVRTAMKMFAVVQRPFYGNFPYPSLCLAWYDNTLSFSLNLKILKQQVVLDREIILLIFY